MPDPLCSECGHAALDSSGVYCKMFSESIDNETTAGTCGEFLDPEATAALFLPFRPKKVPWEPPEQDRTMSLLVQMSYFGKEEHGVKMEASLAREVKLMFGDQAVVTRVA